MQTRKGLWTLRAGLGFVLLGLFFHDWQLLALGLPFLLLYLGAAALFLLHRPRLVFEKQVDRARLNEGDEIEVRVRVRSDGGGVGHLELYERLPPQVEVVAGSAYWAGALPRGQAAQHRFRIRAAIRGTHRIGPTVARVRGPLGMFHREVEAPDAVPLLVQPRAPEVRALSLSSGRPRLQMGQVRVRQRGEGTDFHGLRQYQPSDDTRHINWRASARSKDLLVNQYEMESVADITFLLDARAAGRAGTVGANTLDTGCRAVAGLAATFLKARNRVGLLVYGDPAKEHHVHPDATGRQHGRILDELIEVQARGDEGLASFVERAQTHLLPSRGLVVLVSGLVGDPSMEDAVRNLVARRHGVLVVSPSPVALERDLAQRPHERVALDILEAERAGVLDRLRRVGATVVDWDPRRGLDLAVEGVRTSAPAR